METIYIYILCGIFTFYFLRNKVQVLFPLRYKKKLIYQGEIDPSEKWSKSKVPKKVDVIVIGSGMSGLCTAALYSRIGKTVVVLEQHSIAGGCVHTFKENGYEFDSGFHYIGNRSNYMDIWKMSMSTPVEFRVFNDFDSIKFNKEKPFVFTAPKKTFIQNLKNEFPHMTSEINSYFANSTRASACTSYRYLVILLTGSLIRQFLLKILAKIYSDVWNKTTSEIMQKTGISKDKRLVGLLNGQLGDLGVSPDDISFSDQSSLLNHYLNGSIYPKEGPMEIVKSILGTILANGSIVLCKARVSKIITEKGKVKGVVVNDDTTIDAPIVISSVGIIHTNDLIPSQYQLPVQYQDGIGHFYLFVGIKGNAQELNIPKGNMWHYSGVNDYNLTEQREKYLSLTSEELTKNTSFMTFTCFSSVKAQEVQQTDKFSCIMLAEAKREWVKQYEVSDVKRTSEYANFKKSMQEKLLVILLENFPQLKGKIDFVNLGTPLTNKNYYNRYSSYGLQYGVKRSQDDSQFLNPKTKVKGLYLTGQDIFMPGIAPSVMSGLITFLKSTSVI